MAQLWDAVVTIDARRVGVPRPAVTSDASLIPGVDEPAHSTAGGTK